MVQDAVSIDLPSTVRRRRGEQVQDGLRARLTLYTQREVPAAIRDMERYEAGPFQASRSPEPGGGRRFRELGVW